MKVQDLLKKFDIDLNLSEKVLNIEVNADYDSYKVIKRTLKFINKDAQLDYGHFDCIHFENEDFYFEIVPDCNIEHILSFHKLDDKWVGIIFDKLGNISGRT